MNRLFYLIVLLACSVLPSSLQAQTYCQPSNYGCSAGDYPDSFRTMNGNTNVAFLPGTCTSNMNAGYDYETGVAGDTCSGLPGQMIQWIIYNQNSYGFPYTEDYAIFVDFNNNGSFSDPGEMVYNNQITGGGFDSGHFFIPVNATVGYTRMRLACIYGASSIDPCNTQGNSGEMIDFDFHIIGCIGMPLADTIASAPITLANAVCYGSNVTINAGNPNSLGGISVQWQQAPTATGPWSNVVGGVGGTTLSYTTAPVTSSMYYRIKDSCKNSHMVNYSTVYYVPMNMNAIAIVNQPTNVTTCPGYNPTFTVTATPAGQVNYQWLLFNGVSFNNITNGPVYSGTTTNTLQINGATVGMNGYQYRCVLTGNCLIPNTTFVDTLNVKPTIITAQPTSNPSTCINGTLALSTLATGANLTYQWQVDSGTGFHNVVNSAYYNGNTAATLNISNAYSAMTGNVYRCIVTGLCGSVTSNTSTLTIAPPVTTITAQSSTTLCLGNSVTLNAHIAGVPSAFQWNNNGVAIPGATDSFYSVGTPGAYTCTVTNTQNCTNLSNTVNVNFNTPLASYISINGPLTFCTGGNVILSAANPVNGITYAWQLNGVYISGATSTSYTAVQSGNYTLVEYDGNCYTTSPAVTVNVIPYPAATITYAGLPYFCTGDSIALNANTGTGYTYQWMNAGSNIFGATQATYQATTTGTYSVKVTNSNGCATTSNGVSLTANPLPTASISAIGSTTICSGNSVVLNATAGVNLSYQWQLNGTNISGATGSSYTAGAAGNYTVIVTNNTANGCSATSSAMVVTVNQSPTANINAAGPTSFCVGNFVTLNTNTGAGLSHQWTLNGIGIPGETNAYINATSTGAYAVINATVNCSTNSPSLYVTASPIPADSILLNGPAVICTGGSLLLQTYVMAGQSYQWLRNGFSIPGATNYLYSATSAGSYSVQVTHSGCTAIATPVAVTLSNVTLPAISFGLISNGIQLSVPNNYVSYQWFFNGNLIPNANASIFNTTQYGTYYVVVTDANGCTAQSDNFDYTNTTSVGRVTIHSADIHVYPNPATSVVNIQAPAPLNITLTGIDGRLILQENNTNKLDISNVATGMYLLRIFDTEGNLIKVEKLTRTQW